jgi:hypothetical protein
VRNAYILLLLSWGAVSGAQAQCQPARRALVVGINTYEMGKARKAAYNAGSLIVPRSPVMGSGERPSFLNLEGAVNDAVEFSVLLQKYGFEEKNIELLTEEKATAQNILDRFQAGLIDASGCPGDVSVFFYSGHGSEIRNIARPENSTDAYDQTIVPYDAPDGVADIRDKELVRLYLAAAKKGIWLTVVADSCHSGGLSRGAARFSRGKDAPKDPRYVNDKGIVEDPTRKDSGVPHPVLVMAAAYENEEAKEDDTGDEPHGAFTKALLEKLRDHPENEAIGSIFSDVQASVASRFGDQHPQLFGEGRGQLDMFGQQANSAAGMTVRFRRINPDGTYLLDRGTVSGIYEDCVLKSKAKDSNGLRLRVTKARLADVDAQIEAGSAVSLRPGDRFTVERWVVPQNNALVVYYEKNGPPPEELAKAASAVAKLEADGIKIVRDPSAETPKYQIWWTKGNWRLITGPSGAGSKLGPSLDTDGVKKLVGLGASVFVNFPLPAASGGKMELGDGTKNDAVRVQQSPAGPDYVLAGQWNSKEFSYAWIRPGVTGEDQKDMHLPVRTDWFSTASATFEQDLRDMALKLNRIKGWMTLGGPPGGSGEQNSFPYHLGLRKAGSSDYLREKESHTVKGERYKVWLTASPAEIASATSTGDIPQRWIYVLAIDRNGTIDVIIPAAEGNVGNHVPTPGTQLTELQLTAQPYDFSVAEPLGLDTYILLVSPEPIDPRVLPASGVTAKAGSRRNLSPLASLLSNIGANTRSRGSEKPPAVPTNWSVQRLTFRSSEK